MYEIVNEMKASSVSRSIPDKPTSHSEKQSSVSTTSIELDFPFYQEEESDTTDATSLVNTPKLFYDFQAKNFGADQVEPILDEKCLPQYILFPYRIHRLYVQYAPDLVIWNTIVLTYLYQD